jgi:hypothetical protein
MGYLYFEKIIPVLILLWRRLSDLFILFYQEIKCIVEHILSEI